MGADGDDLRGGAGRLDQYKLTTNREKESARRREALQAQQSEARAKRMDELRRIAMETLLTGEEQESQDADVEVEVDAAKDDDDVQDEGMGKADGTGASDDVEMGTGQAKAQKQTVRRRLLTRTLWFARQLQVPDWMVQVPEDFATNWLLLVRPDGDRCLLLSDGGRVEVRRKNGHVLERYQDSRFPKGLTILDVVCMEEATAVAQVGPQQPEIQEDLEMADGSEAVGRGRSGKGSSGKGGRKGYRPRPVGKRTYALCDVLVWGDADMMGADAECRLFWLSSRFSELEKEPRRARPLRLIPAVPVSPITLCQAYLDEVDYVKDSLLFLHREGHYFMSEGVTPLALQWRDRQLNRFVVDTPDPTGKTLPERQAIVLRYRGKGFLRTADHAIVAQLSEEQVAEAVKLNSGRKTFHLLRVDVASVDIAAKRLVGVRPIGHVAARSRVWPDSWGRIVFQHLHRQGDTADISFQVLSEASSGHFEKS